MDRMSEGALTASVAVQSAYRLDDVPTADPIGVASFLGDVDAARLLLRDDPALLSGLLCDALPWHVADA
jgi:hypothetical protein